MSATARYLSMSLDGFIADPNVTRDNGLGDGLRRYELAILSYHLV